MYVPEEFKGLLGLCLTQISFISILTSTPSQSIREEYYGTGSRGEARD